MKTLRVWMMRVLAVALGAMLLSACGSAQESMPPSVAMSKGMSENMLEAAPVGDDLRVSGGAAPADLPDIGQRLVIRNADIDMVVPNPKQTVDDITKLAEQMGGYVVEANVYTRLSSDGVEMPYGNITIRVPADKFADAVAQIGAMAEQIDRKEVNGQDVTEEYVDLEARLKNLEATEAQLQRIMEEATTTEDVLTVYQELSRVRGEIEQVKGRMKYLQTAAAMSSITVSLTPSEAAKPFTIGGWEPVGVAKDAILMLLRTLRGIANIVIWLVLYFLPVLLTLVFVFGYPTWWAGRWAYRRWLKPRQSAATDKKKNQRELGPKPPTKS